jgi:hypothetical protein
MPGLSKIARMAGTVSLSGNQVQAEWIEQYEPGVYITLTTLRDALGISRESASGKLSNILLFFITHIQLTKLICL